MTTPQLMKILKEEYGINSHRQTIKSDIGALIELNRNIYRKEKFKSDNKYI